MPGDVFVDMTEKKEKITTAHVQKMMHKIKTSIIWKNVMAEKSIVAVSFSIFNQIGQRKKYVHALHFPNVVWFPF